MPVYTYECENGHRFEVKQHFSDASLTECITCGAKVHRVIQPVGVVFKGSGFYVNDSRGKQSLATVGTKKDEAKSAEGGSSNGGDSAAASTSSSDNGGEGASKPAKAEESAKPAVESSKESSKNGSSNGSSSGDSKS